MLGSNATYLARTHRKRPARFISMISAIRRAPAKDAACCHRRPMYGLRLKDEYAALTQLLRWLEPPQAETPSCLDEVFASGEFLTGA